MATPDNQDGHPDPERRKTISSTLHINRSPNESTVKRDLRHYHVVFICISGVLGGGLYVRSGTILQAGSVEAVAVSFAVLGLISICVMRTIGEMILIWPIPNALVRFVREFVDVELGTTVAIAYWFTYAIGFASLLSAAASEAGIWTCSNIVQGYGFLLAPAIILFILACLPVKLYGHFEVFGGSLKLLFITAVVIVTIYIRIDANPATNEPNNYTNATTLSSYTETEANNEHIAIIMGLLIAAWGYVGVEIPAALALEVKLDKETERPLRPENLSMQDSGDSADTYRYSLANRPLKFSVKWLPILIASVYFVAGMIAAAAVTSQNTALPGTSLSSQTASCNARPRSIFIVAAADSGIGGLADAFTVFLQFTAWSSALTALYIASRTLFAATREIDVPLDDSEGWLRSARFLVKHPKTLLKYCSHTTAETHVPVWAVLVSAVSFVWLPAIYIAKGATTITVLGVLTDMGSVCCVFVWACECLAYLQFWRNLRRHANKINESTDSDMRFVRRKPASPNDPLGRSLYPWIAWGQPGIAILGFTGCFFILVVASGSAIWKGWNGPEPAFFAAYLPLLLFLGIWVALKLCNRDLRRYSEQRKKWKETSADERVDLPSFWFGYSLRSWDFGFEPALDRLNTIRRKRIERG